MLDAINGALSFNGNLLEPHPNQDRTTDMVSDNSGYAALISFKSSQLFRFTVKLLDLPAKVAHILYDLHVVLSHLVRHDVVRALGGQHYSE